jgi:hypothetical protein
VATGYFEIGGLLGLKEEWQKVDAIRILMGDEVSRRTRKAFSEGLQQVNSRLDDSLETEKEKNDFLTGVPAIVEAIRSGKIQCRVYKRDKFHAKTYITHARQEVVGSFALVGSSNLTLPGITENIELNVQIAGTPVSVLQEWYEEHWNAAEDVTAEILQIIERHTREYTPFEVYVRALHEFCRGHRLTANEWEAAGPEHGGSCVYSVLDYYQKEGYHALMEFVRQFGGAFLCDGVGLGKTFIGLMAIERLVMHEGKRVVLFVPKTARVDVWERALRRYLPHVGGTSAGDFSSLVVLNHTDLGRGGEFPNRFQRIKELADVIVIDEAHHFRNPGRIGDDGGCPSRLGLRVARAAFIRLLAELIHENYCQAFPFPSDPCWCGRAGGAGRVERLCGTDFRRPQRPKSNRQEPGYRAVAATGHPGRRRRCPAGRHDLDQGGRLRGTGPHQQARRVRRADHAQRVEGRPRPHWLSASRASHARQVVAGRQKQVLRDQACLATAG